MLPWHLWTWLNTRRIKKYIETKCFSSALIADRHLKKRNWFWRKIRAILHPRRLLTWPACNRYYELEKKTVCEEFWSFALLCITWLFHVQAWFQSHYIIVNPCPGCKLVLFRIIMIAHPLNRCIRLPKNTTTSPEQGQPWFTVSHSTERKAVFHHSMASNAIINQDPLSLQRSTFGGR